MFIILFLEAKKSVVERMISHLPFLVVFVFLPILHFDFAGDCISLASSHISQKNSKQIRSIKYKKVNNSPKVRQTLAIPELQETCFPTDYFLVKEINIKKDVLVHNAMLQITV